MRQTRAWRAAARTAAVALIVGSAAVAAPRELAMLVGGKLALQTDGRAAVRLDGERLLDLEVTAGTVQIRGLAAGSTRLVVTEPAGRVTVYDITVVSRAGGANGVEGTSIRPAAGPLADEPKRTEPAQLGPEPARRPVAAGLRRIAAEPLSLPELLVTGSYVMASAPIDSVPGFGLLPLEQRRGAAAPALVEELPEPAVAAAAPVVAPAEVAVPPLAPPTAPSGPVVREVTASGVVTVTPIAAAPGPQPPPLPGLPELGVTIDEAVERRVIETTVNKGLVITVPTQVEQVYTASPEIADVLPMPPREVLLTAKSAGETTVIVWYAGPDRFLQETEVVIFDVTVLGPADPSAQPGDMPQVDEVSRVLELLGIDGVEVMTSGRGESPSVIVAGEVDSEEARSRAEQAIAALFPNSARVTNFIRVRTTPAMSPEQLETRQAELETVLAEALPNAAVRARLKVDSDGRARVYLSGNAATPADRLRAEELVRFELGPDVEITNDITTPLPPPPADLLGGPAPGDVPLPPVGEAIAAALQVSGVPYDRVRVTVSDELRRVDVRGTVRNEQDRGELLDALDEALARYPEGYLVRDQHLVIKVPRVITEVQILEMSALDEQQFGVSWGTPLQQQGATTTGSTQLDSSSLAVYGEAFVGAPFERLDPIAARVRALVNNNKARVLQQPYITSDDGEEGTAEVVTEIPLPSTTTGTGGVTGTQVEFRPVGIRLLVTPQILWGEPEAQIQLDLETEVSAVDFGLSINIGGSQIPAITNRRAQSIVTVSDGSTLVLGGLTTETERKNVSRIPLIGDVFDKVPIIGALFRYTERRTEQVTVVVVMTPRILL